MMRRRKHTITGIFMSPAIRAAYDRGDRLAAQRLILAHLRREIDGPRTVARQRGRRKVLCVAR